MSLIYPQTCQTHGDFDPRIGPWDRPLGPPWAWPPGTPWAQIKKIFRGALGELYVSLKVNYPSPPQSKTSLPHVPSNPSIIPLKFQDCACLVRHQLGQAKLSPMKFFSRKAKKTKKSVKNSGNLVFYYVFGVWGR